MGAQLALYFLDLDLDAARADDIVFATKNAEAGGEDFNDIVGDEGLWAHLGGIDDQTAIRGLGDRDGGEGRVPFGGIGTIEAAQGDVREGLGHAISAPNGMGEGAEFGFHRFVDGTTTDNQVADLHQARSFLRYLQRVIDLHGNHGCEV